MCFRTISIVTDHVDKVFKKDSVFVLRSTPEDENTVFLKRSVCEIRDNGNSPKTH
jgi:hypothetical protein